MPAAKDAAGGLGAQVVRYLVDDRAVVLQDGLDRGRVARFNCQHLVQQ